MYYVMICTYVPTPLVLSSSVCMQGIQRVSRAWYWGCHVGILPPYTGYVHHQLLLTCGMHSWYYMVLSCSATITCTSSVCTPQRDVGYYGYPHTERVMYYTILTCGMHPWYYMVIL